jgi:hypothetical protein
MGSWSYPVAQAAQLLSRLGFALDCVAVGLRSNFTLECHTVTLP